MVGVKIKDAILRPLYRIAGTSALLQLITLAVMALVIGLLGEKPTTAAAYFTIYGKSPLEAFLRGDFLVMILIGLYLETIPRLTWCSTPCTRLILR